MKRKLLDRLLKGGGRGKARRNPIEPRAPEGDPPLSFAQERLWVVDKMRGGASIEYNMRYALHFEGNLDIEALKKALVALQRRHHVLRTTYHEGAEGQPIQRIHEDGLTTIEVEDLGSTPSPKEAARDVFMSEADVPFELETEFPVRFRILRLGPQENVLLMTFHHIAFDGSSIGPLFEELAADYRSLVAGDGELVSEPALQYADYAAWQRRTLTEEVLAEHLEYWKERLDGVPQLDLGLKSVQNHTADTGAVAARFEISREVLQRLDGIAKEDDATLFMCLMAAFKLQLSKYAGHDDIVIGSPEAGRQRPEVRGMVGFFVNMLVLRSDLSGCVTFGDVVERVRATCLGAYEHQDVPFEGLVMDVAPDRDPDENPLFQIAFQFNPDDLATVDGWELPGLQVSSWDPETSAAMFDVLMTLEGGVDGLRGRLLCNAAEYDETTARAMARQFSNVLAQVAEDPDIPLTEVSLMAPDERRRLLADWSGSRHEQPSARVHTMFAEHARRQPDAVAVIDDDVQMTYGELEAWSNRLARTFVARGAMPGDRIAVCLRRGADLIASFLGALKAGAAYVPLDPDVPSERVRWMAADAEARLVVVGDAQKEIFDGSDELMVNLDDRDTLESDATAPEIQVAADDLAHVIYTSGSTGEPKGVRIPHRGMERLVADATFVKVTPGHRMAQTANACFDAATYEIWAAIANGATLIVVPTEVVLDVTRFKPFLQEHRPDTLFVTTALFNQLARSDPTIFAGLANVLFGGEAVTPHWVRLVMDASPPERLFHMYGPSESTTYATYWQVDHVPEHARTLPIGRPVENTTVYVLDDRMMPVPVGVPGELFVAGDGLASGYWNRPHLTVKAFVPNPFSDQDNAWMYRTGDLVRWREDGLLEYLGRRDDQVKVRGHRVEPSEIASVLKQHPGVDDAVVLATKDVQGTTRLLAYLQVGDVERFEVGQARDYARTRLPAFMVPARFLPMAVFPLTPTGKVDRSALPAPDDLETETREYVAPRTPTEEILAEIWSRMLEVQKVGMNDDFFDLGGHSLLAVQTASQIRDRFGVDVEVRAIFEDGTIERLARTVEEAVRRSVENMSADEIDERLANE